MTEYLNGMLRRLNDYVDGTFEYMREHGLRSITMPLKSDNDALMVFLLN